MTTHYLDVVCPNCNRLLAVPVRIGQVHVNPKSLYLVNLSASIKHTCRVGREAPTCLCPPLGPQSPDCPACEPLTVVLGVVADTEGDDPS